MCWGCPTGSCSDGPRPDGPHRRTAAFSNFPTTPTLRTVGEVWVPCGWFTPTPGRKLRNKKQGVPVKVTVRKENEMTKINHGRALAVLLAALLAVMVLAPIASAQTVGTASF